MQADSAPVPHGRLSLSPEEIQGYAQVLARALDAGIFSTDDFRKMHARFKARDDQGVIWSLGLQSGEWHRQEGSQWVPGDPPPRLEIEAGLIETLRSLAPEDIAEAPASEMDEPPPVATALEVPEEPVSDQAEETPTDPELEPVPPPIDAGETAEKPSEATGMAEQPPYEPGPSDQEVEEALGVEMAAEAPADPETDLFTPEEAPETPVEVATVIKRPSEEEGAWVVTVVEGPGTGRSHSLGEQSSLGRAADSALVIEDKKISRHHALVQRIAGEYYISDQNSVNGTIVNGERVVDPVLLHLGDQIQLGDSVLRVHAEGESPATPIPSIEEGEAETERKIPWIAIGAGALILLCSISACCALVYYFFQTQ